MALAIEHLFGYRRVVDAREASLLEQERRSLAMVGRDAPSGWSAGKVSALIRELQEAERSIVELERRLAAERAVQDAAVGRHPAGRLPREQP